MKYLFFVLVVALGAISINAQTKTMTNLDLTKYRQDREKAERDYQETYARRGFPSPEELARRRQKSAAELQEYSDQLRAQKLELERAAAQQRALRTTYVPQFYIVNNEAPAYDLGYFYMNGRNYPRPMRQQYTQPGYFAGGQFWPTGPATRPRPLIQRNR